MNVFEIMRNYKDTYPCLQLRKGIWYIQAYISHICKKIITNWLFECFILCIIIFNSVALALDDPTSNVNLPWQVFVDMLLLYIYTIEMLLKIIGLGFILRKNAYIRDGWNILDFIIVITAWLPHIFGGESNSFSSLRVLRVLRPLRTISSIKSLRIILTSLFSAMRLLLDSIVMLIFFFMIFAIGGLQLFMGLLKRRCFNASSGIAYSPDQFCSSIDQCETFDEMGVQYICGKMIANANYGIINFDTIGWSFLQVFQCVTLEGWSQTMRVVQDAFSYYTFVYFIVLIFVGTFFLINLNLAIIRTKYEEASKNINDNPKVAAQNIEMMEDSHDLKQFLQWGIYISSRYKQTQHLQKKQNHSIQSSVQSLLNKEQCSLNDCEQQLETDRNLLIQQNSRRISIQGQIPSRISSGLVTGRIDPGNNLQLLNDKASKQNSPSMALNKNIAAPFASPAARNNLKLSKVTPFQGPTLTYSRLQSIQEEMAKEAPSSKEEPQARKVGLGQKFHNFSNIRFAGMAQKQNAPPKKLDFGKPQDSDRDSEQMDRFDESEDRDCDDEFIQQFDKRNKGRVQVQVAQLQSSRINILQLKSQTQRDPRPRPSKDADIVNISISSSDREDRKKQKHTRQASGVGFLEDEDFGIQKQIVQKPKKLTIQPLETSIPSKLTLSPKKQPSTNKSSKKKKTKDSLHTLDSNILNNSFDDDENEEEQIKKYKELYVPEYMIARVNFDAICYQEDDVLYESIDEVLPSLKKKAIRIIQDELKKKILNKIFKNNYIFKDRKAFKKIESNIPQKFYQIQKTRESKKLTNFISKKQKTFNSLENFSRFRQIFEIIDWKNSLETKESQIHKFDPKKFNVIHQLNYYNPECPQKQGHIVFQSQQKRKRKKNEDKEKNSITTYPHQIKEVKEKFYPPGVFLLKDFLDQKNEKKEQEKHQEEINSEMQLLETVKKKDLGDSETDEESVAINCQKEYINKVYKNMMQMEDEYNVTQLRLPWSGEDVMQEINSQYFLNDSKLLVQFNRILNAYNWQKTNTEMWEGGLFGPIIALRRQVKNFALGKYFDSFTMSCVIINTIILALDGTVSKESSEILDQFNLAFTYIFTIDMGLKIFGMGITEYLKDKMNLFDAIIVTLSLVELFFSGGGNSAQAAFRSVRIFRIFRVLRVTRLIRQLHYMMVIIDVIAKSVEDFMYIFMLLILFNYIYALLGMQLYGGSYNFSDPPRMNFDDFFSAYMTVFDLLTIENWNDILTSTLRTEVNKVITLLYLISWIFIGNYVLLNLFLAILLSGFDDETDDNQLQENFEIAPDQAIEEGRVQTLGNQTEIQSKEEGETPNQEEGKKKIPFKWFDGIKCQKSYFIFSQQNCFRRLAYQIVKHPRFETVILIAIVASSLKLVVDTYLNQGDPSQEDIVFISNIADQFFSFFFAAEMLLKSTAFGFVWDENSYLRESWSQLDFFIVSASLIDSALSVDLGFVKILRLLRTLRPLRFISHNKNMKTVVTALLESVGGILNVLVVVLLIWIMFGIFGISLMKGKVHYCQLPVWDITGDYYGVGQKQCMMRQGIWMNQDINFDDILSSIVTLFVLSTVEGWPNYVFNFVDANIISDSGENLGPEKDGQKLFMLYFMVFIFVGSMFLINLFTGVVQLNYQLAHKAAKSKFLSEQQSKWIEVQKLITDSKLDLGSIKPPKNYFRQKIWYFCQGSILDTVVMICIILNIVTMAMAYETSTKEYDAIIKDINMVFTVVFMAECVLKLLGYGFFGYFYSGWNKFDFFVICTSLLDIILDQLGSGTISFLKVGPQLGRIFRVLRVSRLLRLVKQFESLQKLIQVAVYALPPLMNVTALLILAYFIFAILGSFLFGNIVSGDIIDSKLNFSNFHHAILLLFICSTGENWYMVMFDTMKQVSGTSVWFFIFFVVLVQIIMIQLFVLIILQQFEENFINENNPLTQFQDMEEQFQGLWVQYTRDQNGTKIHEKNLLSFYYDLRHPLGMDGKQQLIDFINSHKNKRGLDVEEEVMIRQQTKSKLWRQGAKQLMKMNIYPDSEGFLYYNELFFYFYKKHLQEDIDRIEPSKEKVKEQAYEILQNAQQITISKLNRIKLISNKSIQLKQDSAPSNPMERYLFISMCLKTWLKYKIYYYKKLEGEGCVEFTSTSESDSGGDGLGEKQLNIIRREQEQDMMQQRKNKNTQQHKNFCKVPDANIYQNEFVDFFPEINDEFITPKNQKQLDRKKIQQAHKSNSKHAITNQSPVFHTQQNDSDKSDNEGKYQTKIINLNIQNNYIINNNYYFDSKDNSNIGDNVHMIQNINIPDSKIGATTINIQNNIIQDPNKPSTPYSVQASVKPTNSQQRKNKKK